MAELVVLNFKAAEGAIWGIGRYVQSGTGRHARV